MEIKKRDEVIKGLLHCADPDKSCAGCAYAGPEDCANALLVDAARLLENSVGKLVIKREDF